LASLSDRTLVHGFLVFYVLICQGQGIFVYLLDFQPLHFCMEPITLYVRPYIKKFVLKNYGREPIYVRTDGDLGKLFRLAIARDNSLPLEIVESVDELAAQKKDKNYVKIKFALRFDVDECRVTHENVLKLCDAIENEFGKAMYFYVLGLKYFRVSERKAVRIFLEECEIDASDGLSEDSAVKIAQRARMVREK
jgi:hypothetical protein